MKTKNKLFSGTIAGISAIRIAMLLISISVSSSCSGQPSNLAVIDTFVLTKEWTRVEAESLSRMRQSGATRQGAILCGYAALARGEVSSAARHFLRARGIPDQTVNLHWFELLAEGHSDRPMAQVLAGDALARKGDFTAGLSRLKQAMALDRDFVPARIALGALAVATGDNTTALAALETLPVEHKLASEALLIRALAHLDKQDVAAALQAVDAAIEKTPENALAYNTRGLIRARFGTWAEAAHDFEIAFRLLPEMYEARENWQCAATAARQRGFETTARWQMGVFGTGIKTEADFDYATSHARDLVSGRPHAFLYVAVKGNLPLAGSERMSQQGVLTITVDPKNPEVGNMKIASFIRDSVASGKNPIVFIDVNKWVPKQLGNNKDTAVGFPAEIAVHAQRAFREQVNHLGGQGTSTIGGHSDFTWAGMKATTLATRQGVPFTEAVFESPRTEAGLAEAVRLSPRTRFTVVQPKLGDLFTQEAQDRFLHFDRAAYQETIDTFKKIDAPNYRLALIENPRASGFLGMPQAHGDPANYDRYSMLSIWTSGKQVATREGRLGEILSQIGTTPPPTRQPLQIRDRGGIWIQAATLSRDGAGNVLFHGGTKSPGLKLVYPIFVTVPRRGSASIEPATLKFP